MLTPTPPPTADDLLSADEVPESTDGSSAAFSPSVEAVAQTEAQSTGKSVAKVTMGISALHLLRVVVGFITQPLIARIFGLSSKADVYSVSTDLVTSFWLVFEKIVNPAVLPIFSQTLKEEGEERAWRFASTAICLTALALLIVTPLAWFAMPYIVHAISQKSGEEQRALTVAISRLLLASLWSLGLSSLTYVLLNGYKRFASAALGDTCWRLGIMLAAIAAGVTHLQPTQSLYVLAYGFILGGILKLLPQVIALWKKLGHFRPRLDLSDPLVQRMFWLAVPLVIGIVTSEGRDYFTKWLADSRHIENVEGARAALKFSKTIGQNLVNVFPYALSIGIFPYLADMARDRDRQPFTDTLVGALRVCFFVFGPITAIMIALRVPLLRAVWESGNFTQADTAVITPPFVAYTIGLIAFSCENILNQSFYAKTQPWYPTAIGLGTTALYVLTSFAGVQYLGWGLAAILGAESLQKSVKCLVMWCLLRRKLGTIRVSENLIFYGKVFLGSLVAAAIAMIVIKVIGPNVLASTYNKKRGLLAVALSGCVGLGGYFVLASLLRVREAELVVAFGSRLLGRLTKAAR